MDSVEAVLHVRQDVAYLLLLIGREIEFGGQAGNCSRRVRPRLLFRLGASTENTPVEDRVAHGAEGDAQEKHQDDQRQSLTITGTKCHLDCILRLGQGHQNVIGIGGLRRRLRHARAYLYRTIDRYCAARGSELPQVHR